MSGRRRDPSWPQMVRWAGSGQMSAKQNGASASQTCLRAKAVAGRWPTASESIVGGNEDLVEVKAYELAMVQASGVARGDCDGGRSGLRRPVGSASEGVLGCCGRLPGLDSAFAEDLPGRGSAQDVAFRGVRPAALARFES